MRAILDAKLSLQIANTPERKAFGEKVNNLIQGENKSGIKMFESHLLANKMVVNFNVLSAGMENRAKD